MIECNAVNHAIHTITVEISSLKSEMSHGV